MASLGKMRGTKAAFTATAIITVLLILGGTIILSGAGGIGHDIDHLVKMTS